MRFRVRRQYLQSLQADPLEAKPTYVKEPPKDKAIGDWPRPNKLFYDALLPDIPMILPAELQQHTSRYSHYSTFGNYYMRIDKNKFIEGLMGTSTPLFMNRNNGLLTLDALFLKLPTDIRWMIYEYILGGPAEADTTWKSTSILRDGAVGVARKIFKPDLETEVANCPSFDQRRYLIYFKAEEYAWLESCARRMEKMNPKLLADFKDYFFQHTVLDLKEELAKPRDPRQKGLINPEGPHLWLSLRTHLHDHIRHISLDLFARGRDVNPAFTTFCRGISWRLHLDTVIIFASLRRQEANQLLRGRFPKRRMAAIDAVRSLNVKVSMEVHSFVQYSQKRWWDVEATEDPEEEGHGKLPKDPKEYMAEFKNLDALLLAAFLPNTLRNKEIDDTTECIRKIKRHPKKKIYNPNKIIGDGVRKWRRMQPWEGVVDTSGASPKTKPAEDKDGESATVGDKAPEGQADGSAIAASSLKRKRSDDECSEESESDNSNDSDDETLPPQHKRKIGDDFGDEEDEIQPGPEKRKLRGGNKEDIELRRLDIAAKFAAFKK